jgi:hypothetical protein
MLGFVARAGEDAFVEHLRAAARSFADKAAAAEKSLAWGFCWPNVMRTLLRNPRTPQIDRLLSQVDCVLMEGEQGELQLYARCDFLPTLEKAGFTCEAPALAN